MGWFDDFGEAVLSLLGRVVESMRADVVGWLCSVGFSFLFGIFVGGVLFG